MKAEDALDKFQLPFAQDERRALRLLAPAGSGKTHSLLWRCLEQSRRAGKSKPRFLIFTFTRAAKDELSDRLRTKEEFEPLRGTVEISTLNAWGFRRLKGRTHSLKLLTSKKDLFFAVHNTLQPVWTEHPKLNELMTSTTSRNRTADAIMDVIDGFKSLGFRHDVHDSISEFEKHAIWLKGIGLAPYFESLMKKLDALEVITFRPKSLMSVLEDDWSALIKDLKKSGFVKFWRDATLSLWRMAMITLEDQKYWAWLDLDETLRSKKFTTGIHRYDHILVDEFQDINCLDLRLLQAVAAVNKSELTIIGDDDQAIYEWRGASPEFILKPEEHIGGSYETHILSLNYRSPRNIVDLSQRLIKHNTRRVAKEVRSHSGADAKIDTLTMRSINDSIDYVIEEVTAMLKDKSIKKVAIMGRKRAQIIPYQIAFASRGIPFYAAEDLQVFLSTAFDELKEILGIKARAAYGPIPGTDPISEMIKLVDKIKRYPLNKADRAALVKHMQSERPRNFMACIECLRRYTGPLKGNNSDGKRSNEFADCLHALAKAKSVSKAIETISECFEGLQKDYGKSQEDIFYSDPPFMHLAEYAERYKGDYAAFYEDLDKACATLARLPSDDEDEADPKREPEWKLPLHLMTALRAKGKEYDAVILLDVNADIWPSKLATTPEQLEQERRVFYVAFTRVRKRLMILVSERMFGRACSPSPFLTELGLKITTSKPRK